MLRSSRHKLWRYSLAMFMIAVSATSTYAIEIKDLRLVSFVEPLTQPQIFTTSYPNPLWLSIPLFFGVCIGVIFMHHYDKRRYTGVATDLAKSRIRYAHLAEQTSDVVIRFGGMRTDVSSSIEALTGYSVDDMRTMSMADIVHADDRACMQDMLESFDQQSTRRHKTYRLIHRSGAIVWVEATFGHLNLAESEVETIVTLRDVTAQHKEALELRETTQNARKAHDAADLANRAKGDFLASMSHEIRTPLGAIIGFADLMLASSDLSSTARRHAERIKGGGDALLMIVNDILDFSQAESATLRLDPHPFSLPLLVDECIALVERSAVDKHLALYVALTDPFPPGVLGDASRLRQVLLNLLNNAIKFTPEGSVTLTIGYEHNAGTSRVLFEIKDTGIGIATEDLPRLFQRFSQVDGSIHRTFGGTGLGLAISKMLVELMGGVIGVSSEKGIGSKFWFAINLDDTPLVIKAQSAPHRLQPILQDRLDVLLVEDTRINQELVRAIIEAHGHNVDVVSNGAEAIMAVEDKIYDLVFMDVQMPYVDGLTATRAIRALPASQGRIPIVAMTANVLKSQIVEARAAGVDDVLSKPLDLDALRTMLDRVAHKTIRQESANAPIDQAVVTKLVGLIGSAKVEAMLDTLVRSLSGRFMRQLAPDTVADLKDDAHASIAGSAMLGFTTFAEVCRRFADADTPKALDDADRALRQELATLLVTAQKVRIGMAENRDMLVV